MKVLLANLLFLLTTIAFGQPSEIIDVSSGPDTVGITFTTDPPGGLFSIWVTDDALGPSFMAGVDDAPGITPVTVEVDRGREYRYVIHYFDDEGISIYENFIGTFTAHHDDAISVWLTPRSAEEIEQIRQGEQERFAERQQRIEDAQLIVENWNWYRSHNSFIVEGLVTNATTSTIRYGEVTARFQSDDGTFLSSDRSYLDYTTLLPGQSTTFKFYATYNPAFKRAGLVFSLDGRALNTVNRSELD